MSYYADQTLAFFDVETTGLSAAHGDRICEVGLVLLQDDQVLDTYQSLVNPQRPISPGAARVNGISDADVRNAPRFDEIAPGLLERIAGRVLVCHNAPFDLSFLNSELTRLGLQHAAVGVIDTLAIARRYFHFSSNSLSSVAARLGITTPSAHRALGDALTTCQVYRHFCQQLSDQALPLLAEDAARYRAPTPADESIVLPPELHEALNGRGAVEITYVDAQGRTTRRTITPHLVHARNGVVILVAHCHLRQEQRSFRLERIVAIRPI